MFFKFKPVKDKYLQSMRYNDQKRRIFGTKMFKVVGKRSYSAWIECISVSVQASSRLAARKLMNQMIEQKRIVWKLPFDVRFRWTQNSTTVIKKHKHARLKSKNRVEWKAFVLAYKKYPKSRAPKLRKIRALQKKLWEKSCKPCC